MYSSCLAPCAHRSLPKTAFRIPPEVPPGLVAVVRDNRSMHVLHAPVFAGRGSHNLPVSIAGEVGGGGERDVGKVGPSLSLDQRGASRESAEDSARVL